MAQDTDDLTTSEYYYIPSGVHWRRLDDQMAVYLAERFETHLVDESGCQILEAVQQMHAISRPCSLPALYAFLTGDFDPNAAVHSGAEPALMALLSELVRIGALSTRLC